MESNSDGGIKDESRTATNLLEGYSEFKKPTKEHPYGMWRGRGIIGPGTRIDRGVYISTGAKEATVVDTLKYPELKKAYDKLLRLRQESGEGFKKNLLPEVYHLAQRLIPHNPAVVDQVTTGTDIKEKTSLTNFIGRGGEARHQVLLMAVLLEMAGDEGLVGGTVSVGSRFANPVQAVVPFALYVNSAGEEFVMDPMNGYCGSRAQAKDPAFYQTENVQQPGGVRAAIGRIFA